MRKVTVRLLPWLVTLGLLGYLFCKTPFGLLVIALRSAAGWTVPAILLCLVALYIADAYSIVKTFGWFRAKLRFSDILIVRGASYLLAAVNYSVGQGAVAWFVHRVTQIPVVKAASVVLLMMGANLLLLLILATVGLRAATDIPTGMSTVVLVTYAGLLMYAIVVWLKPRWLQSKPVFDTLLNAGLSGHLYAMLIRIPHLTSLLVLYFATLRAFGVQIPLGQALLSLPIVFFIGVLPISVQGLGTSQAAMVYFFSAYAPGSPTMQKATVLACSLSAQAIALVFQFTLGFICLRTRAGRMIFQREAEADLQPSLPHEA